jgi:hypothetical protein
MGHDLEKIKDGSITGYIYDPSSASLKRVAGNKA